MQKQGKPRQNNEKQGKSRLSMHLYIWKNNKNHQTSGGGDHWARMIHPHIHIHLQIHIHIQVHIRNRFKYTCMYTRTYTLIYTHV